MNFLIKFLFYPIISLMHSVMPYFPTPIKPLHCAHFYRHFPVTVAMCCILHKWTLWWPHRYVLHDQKWAEYCWHIFMIDIQIKQNMCLAKQVSHWSYFLILFWPWHVVEGTCKSCYICHNISSNFISSNLLLSFISIYYFTIVIMYIKQASVCAKCWYCKLLKVVALLWLSDLHQGTNTNGLIQLSVFKVLLHAVAKKQRYA